MRAKIGDVVIDKTYNKKGNLAIVVGEGISQPILIDHNGGIARDKLRDYFAVWDGLEVIGHIDFERIWEEAVRKADRKTEPQKDCDTCRHYKLACELFSEVCKYEPTTQNSNLTFEKGECAKEYEELGLKELKELIKADRKTDKESE